MNDTADMRRSMQSMAKHSNGYRNRGCIYYELNFIMHYRYILSYTKITRQDNTDKAVPVRFWPRLCENPIFWQSQRIIILGSHFKPYRFT